VFSERAGPAQLLFAAEPPDGRWLAGPRGRHRPTQDPAPPRDGGQRCRAAPRADV